MGKIFICIYLDQKSRHETVANEILMLLRANKKYSKEVSLFEPIGVDKDGETVSLVDVIEMENKETLETIILKQDIKELYEAFDSCLKDNEKTIISMRYGLKGGKEYTQREIADLMGISRSYSADIIGIKPVIAQAVLVLSLFFCLWTICLNFNKMIPNIFVSLYGQNPVYNC